MSWSDALLNRALDVASAPRVMAWMSAASARFARRRRARYARSRARMADLGVATRVDLVRSLAAAAQLTDAARAFEKDYEKRSRSDG